MNCLNEIIEEVDGSYTINVNGGQINLKGKQMKHKHAELIKAWADGAEIQQRHLRNNLSTHWYDFAGDWDDDIAEYRIKPEPKPDVVRMVEVPKHFYSLSTASPKDNLKLTFDGETGELKSAEVLK